MIQANAKCVVNGKKLNELISWINGSMEQLDVVDQNNYASKRWFLVSDASDINSGTSPDASRNKMPREGGGGGGGGGGAQGNRDKLNKAAGGGQGVKIKNGGALRDDGSATRGGTKQVDAFGNVLGGGVAMLDDGSTTRAGQQSSGALLDDGSTTRDGQQSSGALLDDGSTTIAGQQPSGALRDDEGQTTAPPRVGATPPNATTKESADIRGKERSNKQSDFKGKASDFEKQRRT